MEMNKLTTLAFVLLIQLANAQQSNYWIVLKDKNASTYSLKQPEHFLSAKALQRRERQHISLSANDLPVSAVYINEIKKTGVKVTGCSKWLNTISIITDDEEKIAQIKALPFVKAVKKIAHTVPKKNNKFESIESNTQQYTAHAGNRTLDYGPSYKQADQIGVICMHEQGYQGEGMTIAVLDAGFFNVDTLPAFDSLIASKRLLGTRDFVTGDTLVYEDNAHGMMVLSCMAGNIPGQLVGTAPKAKFWLLRTEDAGSETLQEEMNWVIGAEFADSVGADIINSSLGYNIFDDSTQNHTYADMDGNTTIISKAADIAASKGIFVTVSAGNAAGPPWHKIMAPADADSVLAVGAIDSLGVIGSFSSRGPSYDGRVKPNTTARGVRAIVASPGGSITMANGTSFASPITAGGVACLWGANLSKTNLQLLDAIQQSASQYATPDSIMGHGIPNFCKASQILTGITPYRSSENSLAVYPNPFHSGFTILYASPKDEVITVELRDVEGRVLKSQKQKVNADEIKLNFSYEKELANGIYIITVLTPESVFYKKIIKE
jgi:serine protease AprX